MPGGYESGWRVILDHFERFGPPRSLHHAIGGQKGVHGQLRTGTDRWRWR